MNIETVYIVINEDNDGREIETGTAFRKLKEAEKYSAPGTWAGIGKARKIDVVKMDDGSYRKLGPRIGVYDDGAEMLRQSALDKLTKSERILLGLESDPETL